MKEMYTYAIDTLEQLREDIYLYESGKRPDLDKHDLGNRVHATEVLIYDTLDTMLDKVTGAIEEEYKMIAHLYTAYEECYVLSNPFYNSDFKNNYGILSYDSYRRSTLLTKYLSAIDRFLIYFDRVCFP